MGPSGVHPQSQRSWLRSFSIIFERSLCMKSPEDRKKTDITPFFEKGKQLDPESYRPVYLTSISKEGDGANDPGSSFRIYEEGDGSS